MPIKFKETSITIPKGGKKIIRNHYMYMQKTEELITEFNKTHLVKGKRKTNQKIRNELVRRGGVDFVPRVAETL